MWTKVLRPAGMSANNLKSALILRKDGRVVKSSTLWTDKITRLTCGVRAAAAASSSSAAAAAASDDEESNNGSSGESEPEEIQDFIPKNQMEAQPAEEFEEPIDNDAAFADRLAAMAQVFFHGRTAV